MDHLTREVAGLGDEIALNGRVFEEPPNRASTPRLVLRLLRIDAPTRFGNGIEPLSDFHHPQAVNRPFVNLPNALIPLISDEPSVASLVAFQPKRRSPSEVCPLAFTEFGL